MENNYRILGLSNGDDRTKVQEAYRRLSAQYNPDNFTDPAQKKWAQQQMDEINRAFDEIMNYLRSGTQNSEKSSRDEFYTYIRRTIQQGDYSAALNRLEKYRNENDAEWQFLMGSALYFSGMVSSSFPYFQRAAQMDPSNKEYHAAFERMNRSRNGDIFSSPYSQEQTYQSGVICCDPCTVCQCLICMDCCCHH